MSVAELSTGKSSTYVHIQDKLAEPFSPNDLCKSWVLEWLDTNYCEKEAFRIRSCGTKAVSLQCPNGHKKRIRLTCHLEICPRCGQIGSLVHKRRYLRALDRLNWAPILGYMVFTLPREVSDAMPSKKQLSELEKEAGVIVRENFETEGCMVRTHFMGEEISKLHIHINVLFPIIDKTGTGKVPKETLALIRQQWTNFVNKTFNLSKEKTNVFYKFKTSTIKMRHVIKYVTRPVVVAEKFLSLSNEQKSWYLSFAGWHNTRWYGQLANCKYKQYLQEQGVDHIANQEKDLATATKCPVCNERYRYQEMIDVADIYKNEFRQIDKDVWVCYETFAYLLNKGSPNLKKKCGQPVDSKLTTGCPQTKKTAKSKEWHLRRHEKNCRQNDLFYSNVEHQPRAVPAISRG